MASVSKRPHTRADGSNGDKWIVRYVDGGGAHRQKSFDRKKEAEAYRTKIEGEMAQGTHVAHGASVRLSALFDEFMALQDTRLRDGRIGQGMHRLYGRAIDIHFKARWGNLLVVDFKGEMAERFYTDMTASGRMVPRTAKVHLVWLKSMFELAIRRRYVGQNPVTLPLKDLRGIEARTIETFTLEQVQALLRTAAERRWMGQQRPYMFNLCVVSLAAFCGLRWGEIVGLTLDNILFEERVIRVRHSLTAEDVLKGPKTRAGKRDVPMPDHIAKMLSEWAAHHYIDNDRRLFFRAKLGGKLCSGWFHKAHWHPLLIRAGIKEKYHFHALRHFAASWMIENGWSLPDVAAMLGHSKFDMTLQVYAHPIMAPTRNLDAMRAAANRLLAPAAPLTIAAPAG